MEKNRSSKILAVIALCVAVVGLSVGFATFSSTLKISSSSNVSPDPTTFNVDFSSSGTALATNDITAVTTPSTGIVASKGKIDNSTTTPTITGLSATFKEPGQKAVYTFYAYNAGKYNAYLNNITFGKATGSTTSTKVCTAKTGTTDSLVLK